MITEFEVRRRVQTIRASDLAPEEQARQLLRLGKTLKSQAQHLVMAQAQASQAEDKNAAAQLARLASHARELHEEVRELAGSLMSRPKLNLSLN